MSTARLCLVYTKRMKKSRTNDFVTGFLHLCHCRYVIVAIVVNLMHNLIQWISIVSRMLSSTKDVGVNFFQKYVYNRRIEKFQNLTFADTTDPLFLGNVQIQESLFQPQALFRFYVCGDARLSILSSKLQPFVWRT